VTSTTDPADPFDLARFAAAQDADGTYPAALAELRAGRKRTHWMWFVLPQVAGLGSSAMAQRYALSGLAEARAYLAHPVLGPRLLACVQALADLDALRAPDAESVLGPVDAAKLRSCLTLFTRADPAEPLFARVLARYFAGEEDPATLQRL